MFCVTFCTLWLLLTYLQFTFLFTFSDMKLFVCILTDETDFDLKRIYIFWIDTWICNSLLHIARQVCADFGG